MTVIKKKKRISGVFKAHRLAYHFKAHRHVYQMYLLGVALLGLGLARLLAEPGSSVWCLGFRVLGFRV